MLEFYKYHGTGNDFIMINNIDKKFDDNYLSTITPKLCNRHFGIGADGLIAVEKRDNHFFMNYINSDGTFAEMCGNGIRCTAKFIIDHNLNSHNNNINIFTRAGLKTINTKYIDNKFIATVNMGTTNEILHNQKINIGEKTFKYSFVSVGNPHIIIETDDISDKLVLEYGPKLEKAPNFPNKTNVEFIKILDKENIQARVWERGCGETLACGSGATSIFAALYNRKKISKETNIIMQGGTLTLSINNKNEIFLTGEAKFVFKGTISLDNI